MLLFVYIVAGMDMELSMYLCLSSFSFSRHFASLFYFIFVVVWFLHYISFATLLLIIFVSVYRRFFVLENHSDKGEQITDSIWPHYICFPFDEHRCNGSPIPIQITWIIVYFRIIWRLNPNVFHKIKTNATAIPHTEFDFLFKYRNEQKKRTTHRYSR